MLHTMLEQYKATLSEQYEELVFRYKIIYDIYCDRAHLLNHLDKYCNLPCKSGADDLVEHLLSFHLCEEMNKIIGFCSSEQLKKYADMAAKGELINLLIAPVGSSKTVEIPDKLNGTISKYLAN